MLHASTVCLYVYHQDRDCLERIHAAGAASADGEICALGEGIVGCAAKDLTIKSAGAGKDYVGFGDDFDRAGFAASRESGLAMAAPIQSEKHLIGVLGVGRISGATGDEKSLLRLVAEIAAATMANRAFLGAARREATTDPLTGLFNRRYFNEKAKEYADRLRESLAEFPFPHQEKQPLGIVSISGGIACFPSDGRSIQEVTRHADAALYRAKEGGRNRIEMHDPSLFPTFGADEEDTPPTVAAGTERRRIIRSRGRHHGLREEGGPSLPCPQHRCRPDRLRQSVGATRGHLDHHHNQRLQGRLYL